MNKKTVSKTRAVLRFTLASVFRIFVFFIKVPIGGSMILPIDWVTGQAKALLANFNLPIALIGCIGFAYLTVKGKFWKGKPFEILLNVISLIAVILVILDCFGALPRFLVEDGTFANAVNTMVPFNVGIFVIMFFLPPLISYGLPEALGVFARPLTRPLFNLPGVSAVTIVSAFMGNFTAGHLQTDVLYRNGKLTHREAAIIATGFCTSSVGLIMSVCAAGGQMSRFTLLFFLIFLVTLIITGITAHIYPLNKYPNKYYDGVTPQPEENEKGNPFTLAYHAGIDVCLSNPGSVVVNCLKFGVRTLPTMAKLVASGIGCMFVFSMINKYTPVFTWIGFLFWPLYKLIGFQNIDLVAGAVGINAVDNVTSQLTLATAANADTMTVLFGCGFGIMTVIFFESFLASLYSTKINIKFKDLLLIWAERTALTVLLWGLVARILA